MQNKPVTKYNSWTIALHWLMLFLIAAVYLCIELRELYPRGSDMRNGLKEWHFMLGLSVWILVVLRLWIRATQKIPAITPPLVHWQMVASKIAHLSLYLLMLVMPILGFLIVSYEGHAVGFFGIELPLLVVPNESMAETIEEIHKTIGVVGYWLIGIHALAALYHHYFIKDDTLKRMLPR